MGDLSKFQTVLNNLTRHAPTAIDAACFEQVDPRGLDVAFQETSPPVSAALWRRLEDDVSYIGIKVTAPIEEPHRLAADLAATALEREIVPIFLSEIDDCGMQRFGFRVELIAGATEAERKACEHQLQQLWNLAIVVDVADFAAFG